MAGRLQAAPRMPNRGLLAAGSVAVLLGLAMAALVTHFQSGSDELVQKAATQKLDDPSFDPDSLYDEPRTTDHDHPNRIDGYGCLFSDCDGNPQPLWQKVNRLKRMLAKITSKQRSFMETLRKPVQTSMQVIPGEPGRLGPRGFRGATGPPGRQGPTGPQGREGLMGRPGRVGNEGRRGPKGPTGDTGRQGRRGVPGLEGPVGRRGRKGATGPPGLRGPAGYPGDNGAKGQDGSQGNRGPRGIAPPGPQGPPGLAGPRGPPGAKGAKGLRGVAGYKGNPGAQGKSGVSGVQGNPGSDAKQWKPGQCKGVKTVKQESICCGSSRTSWRWYWSNGAWMDIDTSSCGFTGDTMYFTQLEGAGGMDQETGSHSIYRESKNKFRIYLRWNIHQHLRSGTANAWRYKIDWCGVGANKGNKVSSVCCGKSAPNGVRGKRFRGYNYWWQWNWHEVYHDLDGRPCGMGGRPLWFVAMQGHKRWGTDRLLGGIYNSYMSWNKMVRYYALHSNFDHLPWWGVRRGHSQVTPTWCMMGSPFPNGDMQVLQGDITKDQYPCNGIRLVGQDQNIITNRGQACCGRDKAGGWRKAHRAIWKRIDTSSCNFKGNVHYIVSIRGTSSHWQLVGAGNYQDSGPKHITMRVGNNHVHQNTLKSWSNSYSWQTQWCGFGQV